MKFILEVFWPSFRLCVPQCVLMVVLILHLPKVTSKSPEALHEVLDAYQSIGEEIPIAQDLQVLRSSPYLGDILGITYDNVLWFHREIAERLALPRKHIMSGKTLEWGMEAKKSQSGRNSSHPHGETSFLSSI